MQTELSLFGSERNSLQTRFTGTQAALDGAKLKANQIETERKRLELEVESKKLQIEKYSLQQFQTKKNEEYKALAHEISTCKAAIAVLEDAQLELMEKAEVAQREVAAASQAAQEFKRIVEGQIAQLTDREQNLKTQLQELESNHEQLSSAVDEDVRGRYQRLRKHKGETTVVGIDHSVCGGCHMKLPTQIVVSCQGFKDLVSCPNCGRILYYARHMDLAVAE